MCCSGRSSSYVLTGAGHRRLQRGGHRDRPRLVPAAAPQLAQSLTWPPPRGVPVRLVGIGYLIGLGRRRVAFGRDHRRHSFHRSPHRTCRSSAPAHPNGLRWPWPSPPGSGVAATWLGILLAYDSYGLAAETPGWPVSFFVVTLVFAFYIVIHLSVRRQAGTDPTP